MFEKVCEQEIVARLTPAAKMLMLDLATSHGLAFAAAFRIDHANEVAKALWIIVNKSTDIDSDNPPSQTGNHFPLPNEKRSNVSKDGGAPSLRSIGLKLELLQSLVSAFFRTLFHQT